MIRAGLLRLKYASLLVTIIDLAVWWVLLLVSLMSLLLPFGERFDCESDGKIP